MAIAGRSEGAVAVMAGPSWDLRWTWHLVIMMVLMLTRAERTHLLRENYVSRHHITVIVAQVEQTAHLVIHDGLRAANSGNM